jgi:hypothetical protein
MEGHVIEQTALEFADVRKKAADVYVTPAICGTNDVSSMRDLVLSLAQTKN